MACSSCSFRHCHTWTQLLCTTWSGSQFAVTAIDSTVSPDTAWGCVLDQQWGMIYKFWWCSNHSTSWYFAASGCVRSIHIPSYETRLFLYFYCIFVSNYPFFQIYRPGYPLYLEVNENILMRNTRLPFSLKINCQICNFCFILDEKQNLLCSRPWGQLMSWWSCFCKYVLVIILIITKKWAVLWTFRASLHRAAFVVHVRVHTAHLCTAWFARSCLLIYDHRSTRSRASWFISVARVQDQLEIVCKAALTGLSEELNSNCQLVKHRRRL